MKLTKISIVPFKSMEHAQIREFTGDGAEHRANTYLKDLAKSRPSSPGRFGTVVSIVETEGGRIGRIVHTIEFPTGNIDGFIRDRLIQQAVSEHDDEMAKALREPVGPNQCPVCKWVYASEEEAHQCKRGHQASSSSSVEVEAVEPQPARQNGLASRLKAMLSEEDEQDG